jgi:hypothetical protein
MTVGVVGVANVSSVFADTTKWNFNSGVTITASQDANLGNGLTYKAGSSDAVNADLESYTFDTDVADGQTGKGIRPGGTGNYGNKRYFSYTLEDGYTITAYYVRHSADPVVTIGILGDTSFGSLLATGSTPKAKGDLGSVTYENNTGSDEDIYIASTNKPVFIGIAVTGGSEVPTSDTYTWTVATNSALDIAASEVSLAKTKTTEFTNTLTYSGSKYTANIPELKSGVAGVSIDAGTQIGTSSYKAFNVTVTLNEDWFEAKPTYSVSGTVNDSATLKAITGATVNGTAVNADGTFTVSDLTGDTELVFKATGYTDKTITYSDATTGVNVDLVAKTISDGTNSATANKVYARSGLSATTADNIDAFGGYEVNGFKFNGNSGKIKLQMVDSKNNTTGSGDYVGRFNLSAPDKSGDYYITYTPSEDGTLTIVGKTGSNTSLDRGVTVTGTGVDKSIAYETADMITDTVDLTAGNEYKISATKGAINIYELTFDTNSNVTRAAVNKVAYVKDGDKEYAVAIVGADKVDNSSYYLKDSDGKNKTAKGSELTEVYTAVQIGSNKYTSADLTNGSVVGAYLYGFNLTGDDAKSIIAGASVAYNSNETVTE